MNGNIEGVPLDNWNVSFLKTKFDEDKTPNKVFKKIDRIRGSIR